jgi:hypothetical protein
VGPRAFNAAACDRRSGRKILVPFHPRFTLQRTFSERAPDDSYDALAESVIGLYKTLPVRFNAPSGPSSCASSGYCGPSIPTEDGMYRLAKMYARGN